MVQRGASKDPDLDGLGPGLPAGPSQSIQGSSGGHHIVDQHHATRQRPTDSERLIEVAATFRTVQAALASGIAHPHRVPQRASQSACQTPSQPFGLVETSLPGAPRMQRHRHHGFGPGSIRFRQPAFQQCQQHRPRSRRSMELETLHQPRYHVGVTQRGMGAIEGRRLTQAGTAHSPHWAVLRLSAARASRQVPWQLGKAARTPGCLAIGRSQAEGAAPGQGMSQRLVNPVKQPG